MQANTKLYKAFTAILILSTLWFSSCVMGKKSDIYSDLAQHGVSISQLAEQSLDNLNSVIKNSNYQQEYIKIVNDLSPETYVMNYKSDKTEQLQSFYKLKALNNLEAVYAAYKLQFDSKVSEATVNLRTKIHASCVSLDSINIDENTKAKSEMLKKRIKDPKFKVKDGIYELTNIYANFWKEESLLWFKKLVILQESSTKGIQQIPIKAFDNQKLKKLVKDPYENEYVLANLYKLQLIKENQDKFSKLEKQMQKISESFDLLIGIQAELMKRRKDPLKIEEMNSCLELILDAK